MLVVVARPDPRSPVLPKSPDRIQSARDHVRVHVNEDRCLPSGRGDAGHRGTRFPPARARLRANAHVDRVPVGQLPDRRLGVGELVLAAAHLIEPEPVGVSMIRIASMYASAFTPKAPRTVSPLLIRRSLTSSTDLPPLRRRQHDPAAVPDRLDRVADRLIGDRRQLEHDVGHRPVGDLAHALHDVLGIDVDRVIGPERTGQR